MIVLRLKSPRGILIAAVIASLLAGFACIRVERVWSLSSETVVSGNWGTADGEFGRGGGSDGRLRGPQAFAVDKAGNVIVADTLNYRVKVFDPKGRLGWVFPVPGTGADARSYDERAALWGILSPCLSWSAGFRPYPELAGPAHPTVTQVTAAAGAGAPSLPYVTDIEVSGPGFRWPPGGTPSEPVSGPDIHLLAGWEGVVITVGPDGALRWSRIFAGPAAPEPAPGPSGIQDSSDEVAGVLLDMDALPGGGVVVTGYSLLHDRLVHFVRALQRPEDEPRDLASYELLRDGSTRVSRDLPVALEVESVAVGHDGNLYVVAAAPPPAGEQAHGPSPFIRELWVYASDGRGRGKLALDCETYTRHLRIIAVDRAGLIYVRHGGAEMPALVSVFGGDGHRAVTVRLPDDAEIADVHGGREREFYVSVATDESYQVVRYTLRGRWRLTARWASPGSEVDTQGP